MSEATKAVDEAIKRIQRAARAFEARGIEDDHDSGVTFGLTFAIEELSKLAAEMARRESDGKPGRITPHESPANRPDYRRNRG